MTTSEIEIPYRTKARPDTGLRNSQIGIVLFLASEIMLFGGFFSAYVYLRFGADYHWPSEILNLKIGSANTILMIASSFAVFFARRTLRKSNVHRFRIWCVAAMLCAAAFLALKTMEYVQNFHRTGVRMTMTASMNPLYHAFGVESSEGRQITGHLEKKTKKTLWLILDESSLPKKTQSSQAKKSSLTAIRIDRKDVARFGALAPAYSTFFAIYYVLTGMHALHLIGGLLVLGYFCAFGGALFRANPELLLSRTAATATYWYFIDLIWIILFVIFYIL